MTRRCATSRRRTRGRARGGRRGGDPAEAGATRRTAPVGSATRPRTSSRWRSSCGPRCSAAATSASSRNLTVQRGGEPISGVVVSVRGAGRRPRRWSRSGRPTQERYPPARPAPPLAQTALTRDGPLPHQHKRGLPLHHESSPGPTPGRTATCLGRSHIHFSLFGTTWRSGSSPRCTSPGTRSSGSTRSTGRSWTRGRARRLLPTTTSPATWPLGYRWDIVLTGSHRTPLESDNAQEDHSLRPPLG